MPAAGASLSLHRIPRPPLKSSGCLFGKVTLPESPRSPGCLWEEPSLGKLGRGTWRGAGGQGGRARCLSMLLRGGGWRGGYNRQRKGTGGKVSPSQTHNLLSGLEEASSR